MVTLIDHDICAALDVSVSEYCVLFYAHTAGVPVKRSEIVKNLGFEPTTVDYIVRRLTKKGFLERVHNVVKNPQTQHITTTKTFYDIVNSPIPAKENLEKLKKLPKFSAAEGFSSWQPPKRIAQKA